MKHKWKQTSGLNYRCSRCLVTDGVSADWCDADGTNAELARIAYRNDCRGKRRKSRAKPKLVFTRRDLFVGDSNHGGYVSGHCVLCGSCGWEGDIDHNAGCILADPKIVKVKLIGVK